LESKVEKGMGVGEASRRKMVKEWKGWAVEEKRVADRENSVAEKRWVRRSKTAIWWMSLWMWGMSEGAARRMRVKRRWPNGVVLGVRDGGAVVAIDLGSEECKVVMCYLVGCACMGVI